MEEKRYTGTVTHMRNKPLPTIIQGGMGAGVSSWSLARAVSKAGQLGVPPSVGRRTLVCRGLLDLQERPSASARR